MGDTDDGYAGAYVDEIAATVVRDIPTFSAYLTTMRRRCSDATASS